jgi:transcription antitermination factor NusG
LETFLPTYRVKTTRFGRRRELDRPLFSGYLFSRFNPVVQLPVLTTPGVVSIVAAGRQLLPVSEKEIAAVHAILGSGLIASPWPYLRAGQAVEVVRGPLTGVSGLLLAVKNTFRLVVSVTLLQRSVSVEVDADWVRPVSHVCGAAAAQTMQSFSHSKQY